MAHAVVVSGRVASRTAVRSESIDMKNSFGRALHSSSGPGALSEYPVATRRLRLRHLQVRPAQYMMRLPSSPALIG
ncbi:hypothetical protein ACWGJQ_28970 [Peribacillus simplex]